MTEADTVLSELQRARERFLALVDDVRPELHRYCARMTGSVVDGEDIVQETLARAYYELSQFKELPALRPWLFRVAHNRALDFLRRYDRRMSEPLDVASDVAIDEVLYSENTLARNEAVRAAVSRFLELPPRQRSCVILKDTLDYSLDEIASMLELSVPAIKAALHRGRARLQNLSEASDPPAPARTVSPALARYTALFNARDWDGVRAMLVDDVKLDLVSRWNDSGRLRVGKYFTNYDSIGGWRLAPGWLDGREVIAVFSDPRDVRPNYFMTLTFTDGRVAAIRDFRYASYIAREAAFESSSSVINI